MLILRDGSGLCAAHAGGQRRALVDVIGPNFSLPALVRAIRERKNLGIRLLFLQESYTHKGGSEERKGKGR